MRNWWKNGLLAAGAALAGAGLGACESCEDIYCAPCSPFVNDVALYFDTDSTQQGFRRAELAGAYAVSFRRPGFGRATDTLRLIGATNHLQYGVSLGSFPGVYYSADSLKQYNYRIVLPAIGRTFEVSELDVAGRYDTEGCCNCEENARRRFRLDGRAIVADGIHGTQAVGVLHR
jgi:hypothetical protein